MELLSGAPYPYYRGNRIFMMSHKQVPTFSFGDTRDLTSVCSKTTTSRCASSSSFHSSFPSLYRPISVFLPASDIPSFVGKGNVDLGITGQDVILEAQMEQHVTEILKLGFGKCALQVQVPEAGAIKSVDDLTGKRVVTSFEVLSGQYFKAVDERMQLAPEASTRIEYVGGSVEAACSLGLADGIGKHVSLFYA